MSAKNEIVSNASQQTMAPSQEQQVKLVDAVISDQDGLKFGVGGEFMVARGIEEFSEGKGSFHSVYGFGKYALNEKLWE